jgi:hypothetical protein
LSDDWEYVGVGSLGKEYQIDIEGKLMTVVTKLPQAKYEELLRLFDVGLALMWAAHPSVLPFELARAGVVTVTNEYYGRSAERLAQFGHNIVACEASMRGIVNGLKLAVERSRDVESRIIGAGFRSPTSWDKVFNKAFIRKLARATGLPR